MDKFLNLIFLTFAVVTFLLGRYDMSAANFLSFIGFSLSDYRYQIIVRFKLQQKVEPIIRKVGHLLGYLGIVLLFFFIASKYISRLF